MLSYHFNSFSVSLLMTGVVALLVSLITFQRPGLALKWFSVMMLCSAIWAICYSFELSSHELQQMLFWIDLEYIGIAYLPAGWIMFVVYFIHREQWLSLRNRIIIFSFPTIALLLVWTNQWHHLHYEHVSMDIVSGPFPLLAIEPGPGYHVHTAYFYFLLVVGISLLINRFYRSDKVYRRQNLVILIGAFIPWAVNFIYLLGYRPFEHIDLTPYAFIATSLVISFGLVRFKLFDLVPTAREKVLQAIKEGIIVLDNDGRVADLNQTMTSFLSSYSKKIVGTPLNQILPKQYPLHQQIGYHKDAKIEIKHEGEKGIRHFEISITPLFDKTGFVGSLLVFWEITERKQHEKRLLDQANELQALNQLKDRMFSIISHDVRTPLASLKGILSIADSISQEELKSFLPKLAENVSYASSLLENLLYWSRSQLQGEKLSTEVFDLHLLCKEEINSVVRLIQEKNLDAQLNIPFGTLVFADKTMVRIVVRNLITNAIKFCNRNGQIKITSESEKDNSLVSIRDTGVGMSPETQSKLFSLETKSMLGTSGEKGTGLGLKLCKDFIEKNGGKIWVESTEGAGSTFSFTVRSPQATD